MITFTVKVGNNRGRNRVWLEGKRLTDMGWNRGDTYNQTNEADSITLEKDTAGAKKVAGKTKDGKDVSIIDLTGNYVDFMAGGRALVVITETSITITAAEDSQA